MNIICVVTDTLRADYLPTYGNSQVIAPQLSAFAEAAIVFEDCHAASFPTVPARADIATGRFTFTYLTWGPLPQDEITLANLLTKAGYKTMGIGDTPFLIRNGYGYDRGFDDFLWIRGQREASGRPDVTSTWSCEDDRFAPQTFKAAIDWLERNHRDKFFLYIDAWDPHEPWDPPAHYVLPYLPDYQGEQVYPAYWDWQDAGYTPRDMEVAKATYMGEISMVDRWFGLLLERLHSLGIYDDTAILFVSDHGFYFGEFGIFGKRRFRWPDNSIPVMEAMARFKQGAISYWCPTHNELSHVPLFMRIPGWEHRRVDGLVSIPDMMPTMLELAGVEIPARVQARSLLPLARGEVERLHDIVVTSQSLADVAGNTTLIVDDSERVVVEVSPSTIRDGQWDFLYSLAGEKVELYDAVNDPGHKQDLAAQKPDVCAMMHAKFTRWMAQMDSPEEYAAPRQSL
ncbi:MAG: sulfatase [Chloroflexi bacterium]|nr:sulfatase [Chloroflexota bacterium]